MTTALFLRHATNDPKNEFTTALAIEPDISALNNVEVIRIP